MIIPAWAAVVLAVPVLLCGELLIRRVRPLSRFHIPAPVVGGLAVALLLAAGHWTRWWHVTLASSSSARWWTWLVTTEPDWFTRPSLAVHTPFLVAFFTCIGLNASALLVRRSGTKVLLFLGAAAALAVIQNGLGVTLARWMGESPLLGLTCGSVSMTGGHGTAMGFAPVLAGSGLAGAAALGMAAATFGLIAGGLLGGPLGGALIRRHGLKSASEGLLRPASGCGQNHARTGLFCDLHRLRGFGPALLPAVLLLLACIKGGAWVSRLLEGTGVTFPVYMGALLTGVVVRNLLDLTGALRVRSEIIDALSSVFLGLFLTLAMMGIRLQELAGAAAPMLVILSVQVLVMAAFAWFVTFRLMGSDFDAAVLAAGHCGFGLGATPSAVANMQVLSEHHGPAPVAFLVVPIVGAFLIDFVNALNITAFLNVL